MKQNENIPKKCRNRYCMSRNERIPEKTILDEVYLHKVMYCSGTQQNLDSNQPEKRNVAIQQIFKNKPEYVEKHDVQNKTMKNKDQISGSHGKCCCFLSNSSNKTVLDANNQIDEATTYRRSSSPKRDFSGKTAFETNNQTGSMIYYPCPHSPILITRKNRQSAGSEEPIMVHKKTMHPREEQLNKFIPNQYHLPEHPTKKFSSSLIFTPCVKSPCRETPVEIFENIEESTQELNREKSGSNPPGRIDYSQISIYSSENRTLPTCSSHTGPINHNDTSHSSSTNHANAKIPAYQLAPTNYIGHSNPSTIDPASHSDQTICYYVTENTESNKELIIQDNKNKQVYCAHDPNDSKTGQKYIYFDQWNNKCIFAENSNRSSAFHDPSKKESYKCAVHESSENEKNSSNESSRSGKDSIPYTVQNIPTASICGDQFQTKYVKHPASETRESKKKCCCARDCPCSRNSVFSASTHRDKLDETDINNIKISVNQPSKNEAIKKTLEDHLDSTSNNRYKFPKCSKIKPDDDAPILRKEKIINNAPVVEKEIYYVNYEQYTSIVEENTSKHLTAETRSQNSQRQFKSKFFDETLNISAPESVAQPQEGSTYLQKNTNSEIFNESKNNIPFQQNSQSSSRKLPTHSMICNESENSILLEKHSSNSPKVLQQSREIWNEPDNNIPVEQGSQINSENSPRTFKTKTMCWNDSVNNISPEKRSQIYPHSEPSASQYQKIERKSFLSEPSQVPMQQQNVSDHEQFYSKILPGIVEQPKDFSQTQEEEIEKRQRQRFLERHREENNSVHFTTSSHTHLIYKTEVINGIPFRSGSSQRSQSRGQQTPERINNYEKQHQNDSIITENSNTIIVVPEMYKKNILSPKSVTFSSDPSYKNIEETGRDNELSNLKTMMRKDFDESPDDY